MENRRVICFGGAGSIGSELVRQLCQKNDVFMLDNNETEFFNLHEELRQKGYAVTGRIGDVRDYQTVDAVIGDFQPDTIFIASALKHVTPNEWEPVEAVKTNILGIDNIIRSAKQWGVHTLVHISTDKVVNGESVMGLTKKIAERIVKNAGYVSVRFGNVLGSRGSVVPIWQRQIEANEPLTVTDKRAERYMMTIPEAVELVIKAAEIGRPGQILIMDMGTTINIYQLALDILKKANKEALGVKMIGLRPGEAITERLMTDEEAAKAKRVENFYVIG